MARLREFLKRNAFSRMRVDKREFSSDERIRVASEVAGLGTYEIDLLADKVRYSPELCAIFGISAGFESTVEEGMLLVHPRDREHVRRLLARSQRAPEEGVVRTEFRILRPDGELRWLLWSGRTFFKNSDSGWVPVRAVGAAMDITERRRAEDSLRRSEERLFLAVRAANLGTWDWDIASNLITPSARCRQLLGITETLPVAPETFFANIYPDDRAQLRAGVEIALVTGNNVNEQPRVTTTDGSVLWLDLRGRVRMDETGAVIRMSGIVSDITESKHAEGALRASEEIFRTFFYSAGVGMAQMDFSGTIIAANDRLCRSLGYESAELLSSRLRLFDLVHPEDRERYSQHFEELTSTQQQPSEIELRCFRKDGSIIWVHITAVVIHDAGGKPVRFVKVIQDITERKMAMRALLQSEKLASVGRMAATIAHEVNNPLAAAINAVYIALADESLTPGSREVLNIANKELARLAQIGKQSLVFYRESGRSAPISLEHVIDQVLDLYETKLSNKAVKIKRRFHGSSEALAVEGEVRHAVANLVANSFDALSMGGMLTVSTRGPVTGRGGYPAVRLTIADNGSGIAKPDLGRLFEPFFTTKADVGTGLGLWVTHELVQRQSGVIRIRSRFGKGTVVSIWLPIERRESERLAA
jgi:PAS domain S-box-containing protein